MHGLVTMHIAPYRSVQTQSIIDPRLYVIDLTARGHNHGWVDVCLNLTQKKLAMTWIWCTVCTEYMTSCLFGTSCRRYISSLQLAAADSSTAHTRRRRPAIMKDEHVTWLDPSCICMQVVASSFRMHMHMHVDDDRAASSHCVQCSAAKSGSICRIPTSNMHAKSGSCDKLFTRIWTWR